MPNGQKLCGIYKVVCNRSPGWSSSIKSTLAQTMDGAIRQLELEDVLGLLDTTLQCFFFRQVQGSWLQDLKLVDKIFNCSNRSTRLEHYL